jgi:hypothetical protein
MNLCVIRQLGAPDFSTVAQAAGAMMSREFCRELFARLMKIRWTTPSDFPGMALIGEPRLSADGTLRSDCIGPGFEKPRPVRIRLSHRGAPPAGMPDIDWKWEIEKESVEHQSGAGYLRTWPAWDHLITGLGIKAKNHALKNERIRTAAPFEGSLCEGLDVKATMRAYIKGERRIYVRDRRPRIRAETSGIFDFVPTVYIFNPPELSSSTWRMHDVNLEYMYHDHVKNGDLLKRIIREKGRYAVSAINFGSFSPIPGGHSRGRINLYVIAGIVVFMPVYFNGIQEARWLEDTGYQRNPLHGGGDFSRFKASFKARYGIELSLQDWQNSLIRMAIPFAAKRLVVIAPDGFTPSPAAHAEAGQKGVAIRLVPHSTFPRGQLHKASRQYCVEPLDKEGLRFPSWAQSIVADRIDAHKPLMPSDLLEYGMGEISSQIKQL